MTRKDYRILANAIKIAMDSKIDVALCIADALASDNPRFNREKFLLACGELK